MNFTEAQNYLLSLHNLPRLEYLTDPSHCEVYLKRLQFLLDILGNPEKKIPRYIHVTGTSGKGSVCLFLDSILRTAGWRVGLNTSPHLQSITERFTINGKQISKKDFCQLVEYIKPKLDQYSATSPYDFPSYFEILEAMILLHFARKKVSWAIIEVGCGGRYDSTNVIPRKDIAVITNIGLDHVGIIGRNKKEIAYEKAGIIKRGARVFTQECNKKILGIIRRECKKQNASLKIFNFQFSIFKQFLNKTIFNYQNDEYSLSCLGIHQIRNAILGIEIAKSLNIPHATIKRGLAKAKLPLRMETVSRNPLIILDGAHNPDKMKTTVDTIKNLKLKIKNCHIVAGFSADKNISRMITQLASLKPKTIACTRNTTNPFREAADPSALAKQFKKLLPKAKIKIFLDPSDAFAWSKSKTKTGDILLVTGSIFLSGELRSQFKV
ncbi:MAG: bifunctional folylpolyglutamate synthase/dihydrofolate synthase [Candidatus Magasanikbacteria bacterium]|nr:bifunctional folylpolyglutamate synthase/dihydrofolate synthase [Candidatus Magasanikbacteria bacterium]